MRNPASHRQLDHGRKNGHAVSSKIFHHPRIVVPVRRHLENRMSPVRRLNHHLNLGVWLPLESYLRIAALIDGEKHRGPCRVTLRIKTLLLSAAQSPFINGQSLMTTSLATPRARGNKPHSMPIEKNRQPRTVRRKAPVGIADRHLHQLAPRTTLGIE